MILIILINVSIFIFNAYDKWALIYALLISNMATNFCLESVRDCILERGGRIRNHELVTYFKSFLNDPENKGV